MPPSARTVAVFAVLGTISGLVCWAAVAAIPDHPIVKYLPGITFGLFLHLAGALAGMAPLARVVNLLILIAACTIGWRLAIDVGHALGGPTPFVTAGALGGLAATIGLVFAWRLRQRVWLFVLIATLVGALGGLLFNLVNNYSGLGDHDHLWVLILFVEWQALFMIGVALALPVTKPAHRR